MKGKFYFKLAFNNSVGLPCCYYKVCHIQSTLMFIRLVGKERCVSEYKECCGRKLGVLGEHFNAGGTVT
jgi:hypothetical protein